MGVGGAMRTGYRYALRGGYDAVVQIDGDGQHDPTYIPLPARPRWTTTDVVVGARFAGVGGYQVEGPRRWAMAILAVVLSRVAGTRSPT